MVMKSKFALLVAALSVLGLSGCRGLQNFFHGAPCATCGPAAPGYLADCGSGCGMEGPVVSGMIPSDMGGEVVGPWAGDVYGGYPSGGTIVTPSMPAPSTGTMAPLPGSGGIVTPAR